MEASQSTRFTCPCCGYLVFEKLGSRGDVCPICSWVDKDIQLRIPDLGGAPEGHVPDNEDEGMNLPSLIEAQQNYLRTGSSDGRFPAPAWPRLRPIPHEAPLATEYERDSLWRPIDPTRDTFEWFEDSMPVSTFGHPDPALRGRARSLLLLAGGSEDQAARTVASVDRRDAMDAGHGCIVLRHRHRVAPSPAGGGSETIRSRSGSLE